MAMIEETAFAKINLDLRICRRRTDGYHDLDSLVVFAQIGDRLLFEPADSFSLCVEGRFAGELAEGDDNLVQVAAEALARTLSRRAEARVTLDKRLPVAAGLGGGSADAAATLRGLARLWEIGLPADDLQPLAATIGADVPVCLGSRPARMEGTGERLTPFDLPEPLPMLLVNPGIPVSTADVFGALEAMSGERSRAVPGSDGAAGWRRGLAEGVNDLQAPAMRIAPVIGQVLKTVGALLGCTLARMSGSGATCFGLFEDGPSLERAAAHIRASRPGWWVAATVCR